MAQPVSERRSTWRDSHEAGATTQCRTRRRGDQNNGMTLFRDEHATGSPTSLDLLERPKAFVGVGALRVEGLSSDWSALEEQ